MSDDVVTLHSLATSVARVDEKLAAFIDEIRGIVNKAEEEKAKEKKERDDAEART